MKRFIAVVLVLSSLLGLIISCNALNYNSNNNNDNNDNKVIYNTEDGYYKIGVPIIQAAYLNR